MAEWVYFIHRPRDDLADAMTAEADPVIAGAFATGELHTFRVSPLRGRD